MKLCYDHRRNLGIGFCFQKVMEEAFKRGLLVFTCGFDSFRFMPPLDLTVREADLALEILESKLSAL